MTSFPFFPFFPPGATGTPHDLAMAITIATLQPKREPTMAMTIATY